MERPFRTLRQVGTSEIEIKRSRFLGHAEPITDEAGFQATLARIRVAHAEASHHAFAYRLGREGETARFSDDGEPGGTAGRPMMEVLLREEVVDALVVVTRYFGGTLLGSGGLTRAYSQTAAEAVRAAGLAHMLPHTEMAATIAYTYFGALEQTLQRAGLAMHETAFSDVVRVVVRVPAGQEAAFNATIADLTSGGGTVESGRTVYVAG